MPTLKLGTRSSQLALIQANLIKAQLEKEKIDVDIVEIDTLGDIKREVSLPDLGGGGVFLKEIETALLLKEIDFAVHSLKDVPAVLPQGLEISAIPNIEDRRDALLNANGLSFQDLPHGAVIGTSSIRRAAQLKRMRPDIEAKWIRGPIEQRMAQMIAGDYDAIILAVSGLKRLGQGLDLITTYFDLKELTAAPGQGALAIESRQADEAVKDILRMINETNSERIVAAERAFLRHFDAGEAGPISGYAEIKQGMVNFYGRIISADGKHMIESQFEAEQASIAGNTVAFDLIKQGAYEIIAQTLGK